MCPPIIKLFFNYRIRIYHRLKTILHQKYFTPSQKRQKTHFRDYFFLQHRMSAIRRYCFYYRAVIKAIAPDSRHPVLKEKIIPEMGFLPFLGRREIFLMQNGFQPMVYPNPVVKKEFDDWRTHIYVDVSGSTNKYWNVFYGLIIAMQD